MADMAGDENEFLRGNFIHFSLFFFNKVISHLNYKMAEIPCLIREILLCEKHYLLIIFFVCNINVI